MWALGPGACSRSHSVGLAQQGILREVECLSQGWQIEKGPQDAEWNNDLQGKVVPLASAHIISF